MVINNKFKYQFKFLYDTQKREGVKAPSSRVSWDTWEAAANATFHIPEYESTWHSTDRVPDHIVGNMVSKGIKIAKVLGKKGKFMLFDNNIIHRATVAKKRHRDVIVFQFKPTVEKIRPFLNPTNTGNGWDHNTFNVDPRILEAVRRIPQNSQESQLFKLKAEAT